METAYGEAQELVGKIVISKRIVRIENQYYPLAGISRVQTRQLTYKGRHATFYPLRTIFKMWSIFGLAVATFAFMPSSVVDSDINPTVHNLLILTVSIPVFARLTFLLIVQIYRLWFRQPRYALVIETAGAQYAALSGFDLTEIQRITNEIVSAIEEPPQTEQIVHTSGDIVFGDKILGDKFQLSETTNKVAFNK
jgi:uncharacterized protein DUF6232